MTERTATIAILGRRLEAFRDFDETLANQQQRKIQEFFDEDVEIQIAVIAEERERLARKIWQTEKMLETVRNSLIN